LAQNFLLYYLYRSFLLCLETDCPVYASKRALSDDFLKLIVFLDVFVAQMYKFLLADLDSSKILVYAFLGGEVVLDGGAELQEIAVIDAAAFVRMILFFHFLLCLHHRLLAALLCLLG
jgi:hypothetical protein